MSNLRFFISPVLSPGSPLGELDLGTVGFNDPVIGTGGSFVGKMEIPAGRRDQMKTLTEPYAMALYVFDPDQGAYLFGGPIVSRPWIAGERRLEIRAVSWKSWMYRKLLPPDFSVNPPVDRVYSMAGSDQFSIARYLIGFSNADVGTPHINLGGELSGVLRDFSTQGSQFKYLGDLIDSMANRDNGFEWDIRTEPNSDGMPSLWFRPYWPKRGALNSQVIMLWEQPSGGNILEFSNASDSAEATSSRCWASGAGQPPDLLFAYDADPTLSTGFSLLTERVDNYSTVTEINTLAAHARTARRYYGQTRSTVTLKMGLVDPPYALYGAGDKVRLRIQDDWWDWDFDSVRIIDRTFNVNNEGSSAAVDTISVTLDLTDTQLPQNDEQV